MSSVRVETLIKFTDERGVTTKYPIAVTLSSKSKPEVRHYSIADAAVQNCWDPGAVDTELPGTFSFLAIWADGAVDVAFHCDDNAGVGKVVWTQRVVADVPLMLGADDSYANPGADDAHAGTLDVIDRIYIKNSSGATRKVMVIIME